MSMVRFANRFVRIFAFVCAAFASLPVLAGDLQLTDYSYAPDPVANGSPAVFTIRATNNGPGIINNAVVTVNLSDRFAAPTTIPAYCSVAGAVMTCNLPSLLVGTPNSQTFTYTAPAAQIGSSNTIATISAAGNTGNIAANDSLTITPTVRQGADLGLTKTASATSVPAGAPLNYTLTANNAGPNASNAVRIIDNLPAVSDYQYLGFSGTGWACTLSGAIVTCDYSGTAALGAYPPVTINGKVVKATSGTVTNIASVQSSSTLFIDGNGANDTVPGVVTTITDGSDLQAIKSMPPVIILGTTVNITLSIRNDGPQNVPTGSTISDTIASNLTIGTLPGGCVRAGQTVTCTAGALSPSGQTDFLIPVTGISTTAGVLTNTATIAAPSGFTDSNLTNNGATAPFRVLPANANLELYFKNKIGVVPVTVPPTPGNPITPGQDIQSSIGVRNLGPSIANYTPANPIRVTDQLSANENFQSTVTAGWSCAQVGTLVTCQTTGTGTLAVNDTLGLQILTRATAGFDGTIANTACTDRTANSAHIPSDVSSISSDDCSGAVGIRSTTDVADLAIVKEVSLLSTGPWTQAPAITINDSDSRFYIRLRASNLSGNTARTVLVEDSLPNDINDNSQLTTVSTISSTSGTVSYNPANGVASWSMTNLAVGSTETAIIEVNRPFDSGTFTNYASIYSSDTTDNVITNNQSSAQYTVASLADMAVTNKSISPDPARVGVNATYIISVSNVGANPADSVVVTDTIDPTRYDIIGTPTTTKPGGACTVTPATGLVSCTMGQFVRGEARQISVIVRPKYPFGGTTFAGFPTTHTNRATVTTSTTDSNGAANPNAGNNFFDVTHSVSAPAFDLAVTKTESNPATDDPVRFEETLNYDVRASNFGPSRATDIIVTDLPNPPAGLTMTLTGVTMNPVAANSGLTLQAAPVGNCSPAGATYVCKIDPGNAANNFLDADKQVIFRMVFTMGGTPPSTLTTFINEVRITSAEQPVYNVAAADTNLPNNVASQNTTVLPSTDLEVVSKVRNTASPVNINQTVNYTIRLRNNGPSATSQVRITDVLPAGFTLATPAPTTSIPGGSAATVSGLNCTGTTTILCVIDGNLPGTAADLVDLIVNIRPIYPYTGALDPTDATNTASIDPGQDGGGSPLSEDSVASNNSKSATVRVQNASISGRVYNANDRNNSYQAGEGIGNVTLTLTGTDVNGFPLPAGITALTATDGSYTFDNLPPSGVAGYTITQSQPGGYFSYGQARGTIDGSAVGVDTTTNIISGIVLNANKDSINNNFLEIQESQLSGYIYSDLNNDGTRSGAGETGFAPAAFASSPQIRLTGTDYAGGAVNLTATVDANGFYQFTGLPPSDTTTGYLVTELLNPIGTSDGLDRNGTDPAIVGSRTTDVINAGVLNANTNLTERNFGELPTSTLEGFVYFDGNTNATKDGSENAGLAGATITLTGTNDLNQTVNCAIITPSTGAYSFPGGTGTNCTVLRPGVYAVTETPPPGLTHTGAYIGSIGGTSGGFNTANTAAVGVTNTSISAITMTAGVNAINYNFGESGQGIRGTVYVDANNNGIRDTGEVGIPGVTIVISGITATNQNICTIVTCNTLTDASGNFEYRDFPGSNATGYTLTEQSHLSAPLNQFVDGRDTAGDMSGTVRGTAGNDVISGILIGAGEMLTNYQFGEVASSLSGRVYIDNDDSGSFNGSEIGIGGVQVTLSGTTLAGQNICTYLATLAPSRSCIVTTAGEGTYAFTNLPAGTYTLTEAQPSAYLDGRETAGTSGGSIAVNNVIGSITLAAGTASGDNLFGERAVSLSGYVYKDPQRDGTDSGSEPRISGVTIILLNGSGVEVARTVTGTDGGFSFSNLPAGTYTIKEIQPAGYGSSENATNEVAVTLTAGGAQSVRFGETVSTIAGNVFVDGNDDGVRQSPAERGIAAVTITLTGPNGSRTTNTAADGSYKFDDVLAGTYTLIETQPATYIDGKETAGTASGVVTNDNISTIVLPVATDATAYDFGERGQGLTGIVYDDINRSGRSDPSDTPIAGVVIQLQDTNGVVIATTTTGADGRYSFPDIEAGKYVLVEIQPDGYGDAAQNPANRLAFTVVAGTKIADIDFGERTGSIAGLVYNDSNSNGVRNANEPVIPGVKITLTGTDLRGNAITQTQVTDATGAYRFVGLPGGTYTITETQPAAFNDAAETVGSAGGTVGADTFTLTLPPEQDATGYLFGERGDVGQINGTVWFDKDHDRMRDSNEPVKAGWTVQLWLGETLINTATTDSNGRYGFSNLAPGTGYRIRFVSPEGIVFGGAQTNEDASGANPGKADPLTGKGEISNLTLAPGGTVPNQSLPLDPSGVVYDSVRRVAVEAARVTIKGPDAFNPALHLLGGLANVTQTVGADGFYQYLLAPSAPAGVYTLSVTPPNSTYNPGQSSIIEPCPDVLTVGATPDPYLVSLIDGVPPIGTTQDCKTNTASTAYYLRFDLSNVSADVLNNNIPIDPILKGAIQVTKTTPLVNVTRGQLVPYTVLARNTLQGALTGITITDRVPAGFQYKEGSARLNGVAVEPQRQGRLLNWLDQRFTAKEEKRYDLLLVVGSGVKEGEHTNEAYAVNAIVNTKVSDIATATVRLVPDPDFDCTDIIGKVFDDQNANGIQDENEPGLPGVRLATARGLLITTDQFGRYHVTCPMIANEERGSNFILKLDDRTLPTGYRITTMNPETVRLTRGKFAKLNFGASLHRVVRVDVTASAFSGNDVATSYREQVKRLATILAERPSVLRIGYARTSESDDVINARINALIKYIRECWKEDGDRYRLTIEKETMRFESQAKGDVK